MQPSVLWGWKDESPTLERLLPVVSGKISASRLNSSLDSGNTQLQRMKMSLPGISVCSPTVPIACGRTARQVVAGRVEWSKLFTLW